MSNKEKLPCKNYVIKEPFTQIQKSIRSMPCTTYLERIILYYLPIYRRTHTDSVADTDDVPVMVSGTLAPQRGPVLRT